MKTYLVRLVLCIALVALVLPNSQAFADTNSAALSITSPTNLPGGKPNKPYSYTFKASGGVKPYKWEVISDPSVPYYAYHCCLIGLKSNGKFQSVGDDPSTHMTYTGDFQIGVKVTDAAGATAQKVFNYTIGSSTSNSPTTGSSSKYVEGKIEKISATEISGWAYDADQRIDVVAVIENVNKKGSAEYEITASPTITRTEIGTYLSNKFRIGGITVPLGFSFNPSSSITTAGVYKIKSIKFNGNKFKFSVKENTTFTIGNPTTEPTVPNSPVLGKHRLVQVEGKGKIYYINPRGLIIPLKDERVFLSYGNRKDQIESITKKEFRLYKAVTLVRLKGSDKLYKIDGKKVRLISNQALAKLTYNPDDVVEVNQTEFDSYSQGSEIK